MKKENLLPWECAYNFTPQWMEDLSSELSACMTSGDCDIAINLLDRFNQLTDKEQELKNSPEELYGVDDEKEEIIAEYIRIHEKYRAAAEELKRLLDE